MSEIAKRYAEDEAFREVANLLYGGGEVITKSSPTQSDLSTKRQKRERTEARIGYATNVVGIAAGAAATPAAFKAVGEKRRELKGTPEPKHKAVKTAGKLKKITANKKVALGLAGGAAGLQVANLGGDFIANRVLARSAKANPEVKGGAKVLADTTKKKTEQYIHKSRGKLTPIQKSEEFDVRWDGEISKVDQDKQQVFGWASIVEINGEPVVDLQGDYIAIDEVEKSAYDYVHKSRKGGDMHLRDGAQPVHASDMIESFVVTPEKKQALGLPEEMPVGWWVGYQVNDPDLWAKVKNGERTGFSIHGRGQRTPA